MEPNPNNYAQHGVTLTNSERKSMRAHLELAMNSELVRFQDRNRPILQSVDRRAVRITHQLRNMSIIVAILVVTLGAGGATVAAQNALPGEMLYPVKIHVNEAARGILAFSPQAKAELEVELAAERLEEAEELAQENKLDNEVLTLVKTSVAEHLAEVQNRLRELKANDGPAAEALLKAIQNAIDVHLEKLNELADEHQDDDDTVLNDLKKEMREHQEELEDEQEDEQDELRREDDKDERNESDDDEKRESSEASRLNAEQEAAAKNARSDREESREDREDAEDRD